LVCDAYVVVRQNGFAGVFIPDWIEERHTLSVVIDDLVMA
jgi:hypothetical protein